MSSNLAGEKAGGPSSAVAEHVATPKTPLVEISAEDLQTKSEALYEQCTRAPSDTIWIQRELSNLQIAEDTPTLMRLLQHLVDNHLMKVLQIDRTVCWKIRPREEAAKLADMSIMERQFYNIIEEAQNTGVWSRIIRNKTNQQQHTVMRILKGMENKGLVKSIVNVKYPTRKVFLLEHLEPSYEVTGGPWYAQGDVDIALVEAVTGIICDYVEDQTWVKVPVGVNAAAVEARKEAVARKRAAVEAGNLPDVEDMFRPPISKQTLVPKDPSHVSFPTTGSILKFINDQGIIKDLTLKETDMEQLLDMMVLDGRLERMGPVAYRTVKGAKKFDEDTSGSWNGFVDAPCGLCPVFEQCGDGGIINARSCAYFAQWLGITE
jgi:DNA-directed RNA polymerase III subunit RPC6